MQRSGEASPDSKGRQAGKHTGRDGVLESVPLVQTPLAKPQTFRGGNAEK